MTNPYKELSESMAAISVVKSTEVVESANNDSDLLKMQDKLSDAMHDALNVKAVMGSLEPKDVTLDTAGLIDQNIRNLGIKSVEVAGLEELGYGLKPDKYLSMRISGCEGFLSDSLRAGKTIFANITANVSDRYVALRESFQSLEARSKVLGDEIRDFPKVKTGDISVPYSHWRLLTINGRWYPNVAFELRRASAALSGITKNFYRHNQESVNEVISLFSSLSSLSQEAAIERLLGLPGAISRARFSDATFPDREKTDKETRVSKSVIIYGNGMFEHSTLINRDPLANFEELNAWLRNYETNEYVKFERTKAPTLEGKLQPVPAYKLDQIKDVAKLIPKVLNDNEQSFKEGDIYSLRFGEYQDVMNSIDAADWDNDFKNRVHSIFNKLVVKLSSEQLSIRVSVSNYLTLVLNAVISTCESSLDTSKED